MEKKNGIHFLGPNVISSCGWWLITNLLHGVIFINMGSKAHLFMFYVVMESILYLISSSIVPFLPSYEIFGGVLGVSIVNMLSPCPSFGISWGVPPPRLHLFRLHGLLVLLLFFGIYSWRGTNESFRIYGLVSYIFSGSSPTLFSKLLRKCVS